MKSARVVLGRTAAAVIALLAGCVIAAAAGSAPPGVIILPSCSGLPDKTCFGDHVNALVRDDAGPDPECTSCLQDQGCCDRVGTCDDEQGCAESFKTTHRCVVEGGASEESRCKGNLSSDSSKKLYDCMRGSCGKQCGIPHCSLDRAVVLFANPTCDRCMGGACCQQINACYANRGCKLVIECITAHCPRTLGPSMTALGKAAPGTAANVSAAVCAGNDDPGGAGPGPCLKRCIDDFAPEGSLGTTDDREARCLAFSVYACGAEEKCGPACGLPDAGPYARPGEWDEDQVGGPGSSIPDASLGDALAK
jgi:hypothetical protein